MMVIWKEIIVNTKINLKNTAQKQDQLAIKCINLETQG